jgi:tryptophanyl-tRNA synthetase
MQQIDPWSSSDIKDYEKVMAHSGIEPIGSLYNKLPLKHYYFSRGIVFGHKDLNIIIDAILKKKPFVMMTGLMPSGKFHLGHKAIADLIIYFQRLGAECYINVADIESYLTRNISLDEARKLAIEEYLINYIALGLKPEKTTFYFQTNGPRSYMNLSKLIARRITFNELRSIYGDLTPGKIISALTQVADILHPQLKEFGGPRPVIVPVGIDQLPHINLARDIASRMGQEYNFVLPAATFSKFLPGLQGGKMSSSRPETYIALTDDPKTIEMKVKKYAFSGGRSTVAEHRKKGGNPDIDVSYQWLTYFEEDDKKLEKIYNDYKSGRLLTSELKDILISKLVMFLKQHHQKREKAKKQVSRFLSSDIK